MNIRVAGTGFVASSVLWTTSVLNAALCQENAPNFYDVVQENFAKWDRDKDGQLTGKEILRVFKSTDCTGSAAAAIAVLQRKETAHSSKNEPLESFTLDQIMQMRDQNRPRRDKNQMQFSECLRRISSSSNALFTKGLPQVDQIKQGKTNDCYFLAVVAGMARQRPQELVKMIDTNDDGTYTVHFHGTDPVTVARPSDAEISAYSTNAGDGLWLPVLLKAYGRLKIHAKMRDREERENLKENPQDPIEAVVMHGFKCEPIVALFTGHALKPHNTKDIAGDLRRRFESAFDQHRIVIVGSEHHALTGYNYDRQKDEITVWNPWGSNGNYKTAGTKMDHGFFTLSVDDFIQKFIHVGFEDLNTPSNDLGLGPSNTHGGKKIARPNN